MNLKNKIQGVGYKIYNLKKLKNFQGMEIYFLKTFTSVDIFIKSNSYKT